ncbi:MAG: preprotein translocase subunit SecA, partial [Rhizobacter sp.]
LHFEAAGLPAVREASAGLSGIWGVARGREHLVGQALRALHLFHRDQHYVVIEGKVQIVDEYTGRVLDGRTWEGGLHQMIEAKEALQLTEPACTLARITFQRFFRRYHRLAGMSGTLREARGELSRIYGLTIVPIAPRLPNQRLEWPMRWFATDEQRWDAVVRRTRVLTDLGRPVLIGTDSVADSAAVSSWLQRAGIVHALLNANHDAAEAEIVAQAGATGRVTVSTNMAGRGTDIMLDPLALRAGGLHVICCQLNPSRRLDRQLAGRAARQGQPGSAETWISLESARFATDRGEHLLPRIARAFARRGEVRLPTFALRALSSALQAWDEARHARARARLLREDCETD